MANEVKLTLAGDSESLERASQRSAKSLDDLKRAAEVSGRSFDEFKMDADRAGVSADALARDVLRLSKEADELGLSFDRLQAEAKLTGKSMDDLIAEAKESSHQFDNYADRADRAEQRSMGFRDGITGVTDSLQGFSTLAKGDVANGLFLMGAGFGDLASSASNLVIPAIKQTKDAIAAMDATMKRTAIGLAVAAAAAVTAFIVFRDSSDDAEASVEELNKDLEVFVESSGGVTGALGRWEERTGGLTGALNTANSSVIDFTDKVSTMDSLLNNITGGWLGKDSVKVWTEAVNGAKAELELLDQELANLIDQGYTSDQVMAALNARYGEAAVQEALAAGHLDDFKRSMEDAEERTDALTDALQEFANELRAQTDPLFAYRAAQDKVKQAQDAWNTATAEFGPNSDEARGAALDLADAQLDLFDASTKLSDVSDDALLPMLRQLKDDGYLTEAAFNEMVIAINDAKSAADRADGTTTNFFVKTHYESYSSGTHPGGSGPQMRASGGPVSAFRPYFVGEEGVELFVPSVSGVIIPNDALTAPTGAGLSFSGSGTANYYNTINLNMPLEDLRTIRDLEDLLEFIERLRNNSRRGLVAA